MDDQGRTILDAALRLFAQKGVKRTSMVDVAREADVPLRSLQGMFRNKPELLQALVGQFTDDALTAIEDGLAGVDDLGDQLDVVFEQITVKPGEVLDAVASSEDLIDGVDATARAARERSLELSGHGLSAPDLADHVCRCASRIGNSVPDREDRMTQLATLRALCVAATATSPAPPSRYSTRMVTAEETVTSPTRRPIKGTPVGDR